MEQYLPLSGYEGIYEISNFGNVRSLDREVEIFGRATKIFKAQPIKTRGHYKGYVRFCAHKDGAKVTIFVHRAVAIAFLPNPEDLPVVNHVDLNKQHNHVDNLEWVSFKENTNHYYQSNKEEEEDYF